MYETHPAAEIFPMMSAEEFVGLVEDIREHGLREPVVLFEGKVLDGRNRVKACEEIGIEAKFTEWPNGEDPYDYVISKNMHRRHLTEGQRGMIMAELPGLKLGDNQYTAEGGSQDPPSLSNEQAAAIAGVSAPTIKRAKVVLKNGSPEDIEAVKSGASLAPIARRVTKAKSNTPPKPRREGVDTREIVKPPDGLTLEAWFRKALALEADGLGPRRASEEIGIPYQSYLRGRDIVILADRSDLRLTDLEIIAAALKDMNQNYRVLSPHEQIANIAAQLWGYRGQRLGGTEARRLEDFERAFGHLIQAGMSADQIEIPYLSDDRAKQAVKEITEAMSHMRALKTKLEELYS